MTTATLDRSPRQLILRYAKVVTPEATYVKHGIQVTEDGTVYVTDPRTTETVQVMTGAALERLGGGTYRATVSGEAWTISDLGCGCRDRVAVEPTPPA